MPKPRSKRQTIRDERKEKKRRNELDDSETNQAAKRQRLEEASNVNGTHDETATFDNRANYQEFAAPPAQEVEFFGMLSDEDQDWFRSADQDLEADDFSSQDERDRFLAGVFTAAQGKELKLACSQSCSRLMERLIVMSNTRQKKKLFEQFGTHFLNLMQHRFASHCCETLFLRSAPVVTRELGGERDDMPAENIDCEEQPLPSMEQLFLLTLDELEGHLSYLLTDKFASHTLRVLLMVLSGRPLELAATKSLIHSKKKEKIEVPWTATGSSGLTDQLRPVPGSFTLAVNKIIDNSTSGMDATALRVLATHPTGNPVLQLLLELDIALNPKTESESSGMTLLWRLIPGAPATLKESTSEASSFISAMLYDTVGSRILETLITCCPGKVFKALFKFQLADRMHSLVRNDIASYPALRVLDRVGKEDLVTCVQNILPEVGKLVSLGRLNVLKTLFERCQFREATIEIDALMKALVRVYGPDPKSLVPKLCIHKAENKEGKKVQESLTKSQSSQVAHGCWLATTLLSIRGSPATTVQKSLLSLPPELLLDLATLSASTSHVLMAAVASPSQDRIFHKVLVASLMRNTMTLALSDHGSKVLSSIVKVPSKSDGINLPFHLKEQIMGQLSQHEQELRDSSNGRHVWRNWKGDIWKTRRTEWIEWAKQVDAQPDQMQPPIWKRKKATPLMGSSANTIQVNEEKKRQREDESAA